MNDLRLQLIGKLDVNATVKDVNEKLKTIENKINKLKLNIEFDKDVIDKVNELHSKLKDINKVSVDNKIFNDMQKQLESSRKEAEKFKNELNSIKQGNKKDSSTFIPDFDKEINKASQSLDSLISELKSRGFEYQIKFDKNGTVDEAKQVVATIKNEFGELQKLTFKPDINGNFSNVQEIIKNTDPTILENYNNAIDKLSKRLIEVERSGKISGQSLEKFNNDLNSLKENQDIPIIAKIKELDKTLKDLNTTFSTDSHNYDMAKSMKEAADKVDELRVKLERTKNTYKGTIDTLRANQLGDEIDGVVVPQFSNDADIDRFNSQIKAINNSIASLGAEATKARASSLGLFGALSVALQRVPLWLVATTAIYAPLRGIQDMTTRVIELDTAMTELRRVMDAPNYQFNEMLDQSIVKVTELGGLLKDYLVLVNEFARMGYDNIESLDMSNTAQVLTNISDLEAKESVDSLVAAMTAFNIEAENSISIADKLNEVDNQYSVTSKNLATAMAKSSSTAKTFNVDLDTMLGHITAISSATRESGSVVGNSLKTLYSRLSTNESAISALNDIGISTTDLTGKVKSASNIINEVALKWNSLSDAQRQNTAVGVAGVYQLSRWNALMLNYDTALKATTTSLNSQGSAMREQEKYSDSLQARINRLDTAWNEFSLTMGEAIITDSLIDGIEIIDDLLGSFSKLIDTVGAFAPIGATAGAVFFAMSARVRAYSQALVMGTGSLTTYQLGLTGLSASANRATVSLTALRTAGIGLLSLTAAMGVFFALGAAIGLVVKAYSDHVQAQEKFEERMNKNTEAITSNKEQTEDLITKYNELTKARNSGNWDSENEKEYLQVQQQLGDLFPSLIESIDSTGQYHLKTKDAINEEIKATEKLVEAKRKLTIANAENTFGDLTGDIGESFFGDSLMEFLNGGSIGKQLSDRRDLLKEIKDTASDEAIAELEYEIASLEMQVAEKSQEIVGNILTIANAFKTIEIDSGLQKQIDDFIYSLDFSNLSPEQLKSFSKELATIMSDLQTAINSGNSSSFDKSIDDLNNLASKTSGFEVELDGLNLAYNGLNLVLEKNGEIVQVNTEEYEESVEQVETLSDKLNDLTNIYEQILGYSAKGVEATSEMIFAYKTLTQQAELLGGKSELTADQQKLLKNATEELANVYPHLVENGNLRIENIEAENKAQSTLLEAVELSKDGKLSAEEEMTLASAINTKSRIAEITKELEALIILQKQIEDTSMTAQEFIDGIQDGSIVSAGSSFVIPSVVEDEINGKSDELKRLQELYDSTVGSLGDSVEELSKSNSTTEKAKYVTDEYRQSLEKLNLEIEKQQLLQAKLPEHSEEYRKSLEKQLKLEMQKLSLQESQAKALDKQIASGKILQTGNVSAESSTTKNLSGWSGSQSSGYGYRTLNGKREYHRGIDLAMAQGTRLDANVGGKVIASGSATSQGYDSSYGNIVVVQDNAGQKHLYAHLEKAIAKLGDTITAGTQIGTIGSTGRSTGSHLHYEVNVNGKPIDPSQYVKDAKNGIISVVNGAQEAIDKAKSDLNSIQSDILSQKQLIEELELSLVNSQLESFNYKMEQYQRILDYEDAKIQSLDSTSSRYGATLERNISYMEKMQNVNQRELNYLNELIKNGNLSGKTLEEMKVKAEELSTEMLSLSNSIQETNANLVEFKMNQFNEYIDDIGYALSRSQAIAGLMDEGSADWNNEMEYQINLLKENQASIESQRETLKQLLQTQNLSAETVKNYKEQLEELSLEYWNLEQSIVETNKSINETNERLAEENANKLWEIYKEYQQQKQEEQIKSLDDELEREQKRHDKLMKNYKEEMDLFRKNVQERLDLLDQQEAERDYNMQIDDLEAERRKLTDQLNLLSLDDSNEAKSKRKKLQEDLDKIDKDISEKRHDRDIELQKESLNSLLENKETEISELEQKADERLEKEKESIEEQKNYWNQYYEDLINDERKFAEIREQIVSGNFDALSNEFQGYIDELEATMPDLKFSLNSTMESVGTTIRQNIIDNLKEAIELLNEVQSGSVLGSSDYTSSSNSSKSAFGTNVSTLSNADAQVLAGKFLTEKVKTQVDNTSQRLKIQEKGHELASLGRSNGSKISSSESFDSLLSSLSDSEKGQLSNYLLNNTANSVSTPALQDYIRKFAKSIASLDTGGMLLGSSSGGFDGKGAKLGFLHPNEIINNPIDTSNLLQTSSIMERIARLVSPITNKGLNLTGATGGDIYVQFGDVHNATQEQADSFAQRIASQIKRKGGKL